jgi:ADP-heptose:LPS heptosyltransferase
MKILIIRFSSIGDIVLTTPVIRAIKQQVPNAEVHFATKKHFGVLLENNPYIDKLQLFDKQLLQFAKMLKNEKYDVVIDLHHNLRTRIIKSIIKVKTYHFDKLNWEKWLIVRFKINILPYIHIVDRYLQACHALGVVNDGKGLDFFINEQTNLDEKLAINSSYFVYAIGGQHATKKLPLNKQLEMLKLLSFPVVLIGGKEDSHQGKLIAKECPNAVNLCGELSIHQSALLIKNSQRLFTHDTGMMHIAAALKVPIVSIWGNTIPDFGMAPYYPFNTEIDQKILEVSELSCRPCSKIGYTSCPKKHFKCMQEIDFSEIPAWIS